MGMSECSYCRVPGKPIARIQNLEISLVADKIFTITHIGTSSREPRHGVRNDFRGRNLGAPSGVLTIKACNIQLTGHQNHVC